MLAYAAVGYVLFKEYLYREYSPYDSTLNMLQLWYLKLIILKYKHFFAVYLTGEIVRRSHH